jgi:hypothetical protein
MAGVEIQTKGQNFSAVTLSSRKPVSVLPDLWLTFDEAGPESFSDAMGRYKVTSSGSVLRSNSSQARLGSGAALFTGISIAPAAVPEQTGIVVKPEPGALFASGSRIEDFSIDWKRESRFLPGLRGEKPQGESLFFSEFAVRWGPMHWNGFFPIFSLP